MATAPGREGNSPSRPRKPLEDEQLTIRERRARVTSEVDRLRWIQDPRTDLDEDSLLWTELLMSSYALDGYDSHGLFGTLRGLRCLGARLEETLLGVRLRPGELSRPEYARLREQYLRPRAENLESLLGDLTGSTASRELSA